MSSNKLNLVELEYNEIKNIKRIEFQFIKTQRKKKKKNPMYILIPLSGVQKCSLSNIDPIETFELCKLSNPVSQIFELINQVHRILFMPTSKRVKDLCMGSSSSLT